MEKILFVTTNAPGIFQDANSIMLQRLLQDFPSDSYCFLSTFRSEYKSINTSTFTFFKPYLIYPDNRITKFPLLKYTIINLINNIYGIYQIIRSSGNIIKKNDIRKIVLISDNGLCIIGGYLLAKLKHTSYFIYLFDVWSDGYLKPLDKIVAKLLEQPIFKQAVNIFTAGDGICQHIFKKYRIKGTLINNVYSPKALMGEGYISKNQFSSNSLFKIIYCGSIYWPQIDSIVSLINAISQCDNIVLDIYTNQTIYNLSKMNHCFRNSRVYVRPYISNERMYAVISKYDLAFLPLYNYGNKGKVVINTAQPGKLADYLISEIPILIHAPENSYISQYAKKYDFAYVNNDKSSEMLLKTIQYIVNHQEESTNKIRNAYEIGTKFHDPKKNSTILQEYLLRG